MWDCTHSFLVGVIYHLLQVQPKEETCICRESLSRYLICVLDNVSMGDHAHTSFMTISRGQGSMSETNIFLLLDHQIEYACCD